MRKLNALQLPRNLCTTAHVSRTFSWAYKYSTWLRRKALNACIVESFLVNKRTLKSNWEIPWWTTLEKRFSFVWCYWRLSLRCVAAVGATGVGVHGGATGLLVKFGPTATIAVRSWNTVVDPARKWRTRVRGWMRSRKSWGAFATEKEDRQETLHPKPAWLFWRG